MAIQRKPKSNTEDNFLTGGDSAAKVAPTKAKGKVQIGLRLDSALLDRIDQEANRRGMTRTGLITYWVSEGLDD